jgi:hypothetical protein
MHFAEVRGMKVKQNWVQRALRLGTSAVVSAALLGAAFVLISAPRAQADDREKCQHRIEKAEARLDRAVREHGERSSQARSSRHALNEEREHCYSAYHVWWNGAERRWHNDRDWDRDDRDRDHDHDRDDHR